VKFSSATLVTLALILAASMVISLGVGAVSIAPARVVQILLHPGDPSLEATETTIVWNLRLVRVLLAALIGAALGSAGAGFQGLFRNPLADPFVIGASTGAAAGATLAIVLGLSGTLIGLDPVSLCALAGAVATVAAVYVIASIGNETPTLSLLLTGVAVSSLMGAIVSLMMFLHDEKLVTIFGWLMGSFSGRGWATLRSAAPLILAAIGMLWLTARSLDALTFGEESATSLGLRLTRVRGTVVVAASLATAAAVAAAGVIGFIGLIAPHIARRFVGAQHALVIPASALTGALLLVLADDVARSVAAPSELPVGIITALLGCPFFLFLLVKRRREFGTG